MEKRVYTTAAAHKIVAALRREGDRTLTVHDLLEKLAADGSLMNKTTVYRNLDKLVAAGSVIRYADKNGESAAYQYVGDHACHGHLHLQCVVCGRVYHLDGGVTAAIGDHTRKNHAFSLQCEGSVLYGRCADCTENG